MRPLNFLRATGILFAIFVIYDLRIAEEPASWMIPGALFSVLLLSAIVTRMRHAAIDRPTTVLSVIALIWMAFVLTGELTGSLPGPLLEIPSDLSKNARSLLLAGSFFLESTVIGVLPALLIGLLVGTVFQRLWWIAAILAVAPTTSFLAAFGMDWHLGDRHWAFYGTELWNLVCLPIFAMLSAWLVSMAWTKLESVEEGADGLESVSRGN